MAPKILIVGAGPTGLTAAVELARRGIVPTLIERRAGPSPLSRAVGILPPTIDILTPSGAAGPIMDDAIRFDSLMLHHGERLIARLPMETGERALIYGLAQDRTERHLADALARYGGTVQYNRPLEALSQDGGGVTARIDGEARRFDIAIGADGVRSTVRRALGIAYDGHDLPGSWSIADVVSRGWPDPGAFKGYLLNGGAVAIVAPLERHRFRVIASLPDAMAALPVRMTVTELKRSDTFTISIRQAERYSAGRVFLAGDAAHCHSPAGGRGMNLGIADGADLAARIANGDTSDYHAIRHAEGARIIALTERLRKIVQSDRALIRAGLFAALQVIAAAPPLRRLAIRNFTTA